MTLLPNSRKRAADSQLEMLESEMAECLEPEKLGEKMDSCGKSSNDVIIIDCRPLLALNTGVIRGANEVHCPPIVKRRSGGNIPIDNILRNAQTRECVLQRRYSCIVVYDESTSCLEDLPKDSNMYLVIKTLSEDKSVKNIFFLKGGFQRFQSTCPHLCTGANAMTMEIPGSVMCTTQAQLLLNNSNGFTITSHLRDTQKRNSFSSDVGPAEVLPWLFIGSLNHALHADQLLKLGMSALINMAASTESSPLPSPHFIYKNIPVRDSVCADIIQWFPDVIRFIESIRKRRGKVLVHCQAGISRSATICIAYLMYYKNLALEQAFDFLKAKRTVISPNLNFMRQLTEFETQLREGKGIRREASPTLALNILKDSHKCSPAKNTMSLPLTPCMQQSPFAFDLPYVPTAATTASSPILGLHSPLMSPS